MNLATTKLTYQDYLLLPDDGNRYEVIDGDLFVTPSPVTRHQTIAMRLSHLFMTYLETHPIGTILAAPCDVVLSEFNIVEPDLLFVHHKSSARITEKHIEGPPDLVIEILSPGTAARDRTLKRKRYEHFGVRQYWLIDPRPEHAGDPGLREWAFCSSLAGRAPVDRHIGAVPRSAPRPRLAVGLTALSRRSSGTIRSGSLDTLNSPLNISLILLPIRRQNGLHVLRPLIDRLIPGQAGLLAE